MNITKIRRKRTAVVIDYSVDKSEFAVTAHEPPLPSFDLALAALVPVVLDVLHLPRAYAGNKGEDGTLLNPLTVTGLTISEKQEVRLVTLIAKKDLPDAHSPFNIATPLRFMEHPETEGSYSPALTDKQGALIEAVIKEAEKYVLGERAQGTLPLDSDEGDDDEASVPDRETEPATKSMDLV
jgi:hypothetical protein